MIFFTGRRTVEQPMCQDSEDESLRIRAKLSAREAAASELDGAKEADIQEGRSMRSLIEEGLRLSLEADGAEREKYELPDRSVGNPQAANPLESGRVT